MSECRRCAFMDIEHDPIDMCCPDDEDHARANRVEVATAAPAMPELYAVSAVHANGRQIPTFYLIAAVQGITSEAEAAAVAARVVGPDCSICVAATSFHAHEPTP
jgi:hypothetical protein